MFDEDDLLPISALQHLAFCPRQCALIYLEGVWEENVLTVQGRKLHDKAHEPQTEVRGNVRTARGLRLRSLRLGLAGQADVVEFHGVDDPAGVELEGVPGRWMPYPVEYKRGRPKPDRCDEIQLCAQALCLEEMLGAKIPTGALFYGEPRRRQEVPLDGELRRETEALAAELHALINSGRTPPPRRGRHCKSCSLVDTCAPDLRRAGRSASAFMEASLAHLLEEDEH